MTDVIDAIKKSKDQNGQDTLPDYKATGGPSEQQTGYPDNGQDNEGDHKRDGETT